MTDRKKSQQPIVLLLDVLGRRWALRILWELRGEALTFRALRTASANLSPTVLNARLTELRGAGIVELTDTGYTMTKAGRDLAPTLLALDGWAKRHRRALLA